MKLLRFGPPGHERPGLLDADGLMRDLSDVVDDIDGRSLGNARLRELSAIDPRTLPVIPGKPRLGPCIGNVPKFIGIGLNYADHAREAGVEPPGEPVMFAKATSAISGPDDEVILPKGSQKTDWEVELGVVIGKRARYVEESESLEHVAGYCIVNDISERAFQLESTGQWIKGKSSDSFGPVGPWLVTRDEISNPQNLDLWLEVNGKRFQNGNTSNMIFTVAHLISYISRHMTLVPGDVIATGTPPGVGLGQRPPIFLKAGDVMRLGVAGLGEQRQTVVEFRR